MPGKARVHELAKELGVDSKTVLAKLKEMGMVTGGDASALGIGVLTDARAKASYDFLVAAKLLDPAKVPLAATYRTEYVRDARVIP